MFREIYLIWDIPAKTKQGPNLALFWRGLLRFSRILEETQVGGGQRVCFFEGPEGVQLEVLEMTN